MTDWTSGYVADINYTYGYYAELNPLRARLPLLNARLALPKSGTACELGFGQGISTNVHAAASPTAWHGTDFNPSQAGFARELAENFPNGPRLYDQAFAEFCARDDLPDFDYIGLHGIWSWISDENRAVIVDFVRRKLKVGGLLYLSYNTQPGWAAMVPVRNLLVQHADVMSPPGAGVLSKVGGALDFAQKLMATTPAFAKAHPQLAARINAIATQDRHYVAHEYFNRDWAPMSFADMARWLAPAKVDFACSATYFDHVPALHLTTEQQAFLGELTDPLFRQSVYDFMINQQFRRDYWIKGPRKIGKVEYLDRVRAQRVVLCMPAASIKLTAAGTLGEATLTESIYAPLIQLMGDHKIRSIGQIEQALSDRGIPVQQLHQACMILIEKTALVPVQEEQAIEESRAGAGLLNRNLIQRAFDSADIGVLASPVSGSGVGVPRFQQRFIAARAAGKQGANELAGEVWAELKSQQQTIVKNGVNLQTEDENLAELTEQATDFINLRLPILSALGIV